MLKRILGSKAKEKLTGKRLKINESDVLPLVKYSKRTKKIADLALENIIIPFPNFDETAFSNNFWYVDKTKKYGASYQLYVQSLRVCAELINEYENSDIKEYLLKANEIIQSWMKFASKDPKEKMVWYDHPTANRIQVIVHFLYHAKLEKIVIDEEQFYSLLHKHAEVMSDDNKYNNNNHGLMMDRSLMILGNILEDNYFFTKGYYRAIDTFWFSYSYQGIHLENSPEYHNMVTKMYEDIESYLNKHGKSFGQNVLGYLKLAEEYPKVLVKPDGMMPAIGDSGKGVFKKQKLYRNIYDVEAGIAVLQNQGPNSMYVSFVCGYSSIVHKHKDDLSITLNYKGKDFLVDPGKYNYSKSDERKYVVSREAHSSFYMKEYNYSLKHSNRFERKVRMDGFIDNSQYSMVRGRHEDYDETDDILIRTVIVPKAYPLLLIIDKVEGASQKSGKYVQSFNLHHEVSVAKYDEYHKVTSGEESLVISQLLPGHSSTVRDGNEDNEMVLNTAGFGKGVYTKQVQYEKGIKDENVYNTLIYDASIIRHLEVEIKEQNIEIEINDTSFTVTL